MCNLPQQALGAQVIGITISRVQVEIGNDLAARCCADVRLLQMDAEALEMDDRFDIVWSVEAISHLSNKTSFFHSIAPLLTKDGKLVLADWFKSDTATATQERKVLQPIERAMLLPKLETPSAYAEYISQAGLNVTLFDDLTANVKKTWDLATELIRKPALWKFAAVRGKDFLAFLEGFAGMKAGYTSGALIYGALVAQKTS